MRRREFLGRAAVLAAAAPLATGPLSRFADAQSTPLRADGARLNGWLAQMDSIGRTPGGINRVAYSEADLAGRAFTLDLFRQAGWYVFPEPGWIHADLRSIFPEILKVRRLK